MIRARERKREYGGEWGGTREGVGGLIIRYTYKGKPPLPVIQVRMLSIEYDDIVC